MRVLVCGFLLLPRLLLLEPPATDTAAAAQDILYCSLKTTLGVLILFELTFPAGGGPPRPSSLPFDVFTALRPSLSRHCPAFFSMPCPSTAPAAAAVDPHRASFVWWRVAGMVASAVAALAWAALVVVVVVVVDLDWWRCAVHASTDIKQHSATYPSGVCRDDVQDCMPDWEPCAGADDGETGAQAAPRGLSAVAGGAARAR